MVDLIDSIPSSLHLTQNHRYNDNYNQRQGAEPNPRPRSTRRPRGQEQLQEEGAGRPATRMKRALSWSRIPKPTADSSTSSRCPNWRAYHAKGRRA